MDALTFKEHGLECSAGGWGGTEGRAEAGLACSVQHTRGTNSSQSCSGVSDPETHGKVKGLWDRRMV